MNNVMTYTPRTEAIAKKRKNFVLPDDCVAYLLHKKNATGDNETEQIKRLIREDMQRNGYQHSPAN